MFDVGTPRDQERLFGDTERREPHFLPPAISQEVKNVSVVLTKSEENKDSLPELFASGGGVFRFTHPRISPPPTLFGTLIDTGPVMEEVEAEIKDISATLGSFREAAVGAGVKMSFRPLAPMHFSLLAEDVTIDKIAFNAAQA